MGPASMLRLLALAALSGAALLASCGGDSASDQAQLEPDAATATAAAQATAGSMADQSTTPEDGRQTPGATDGSGHGDTTPGAVGPLTPGIRRTQAPPAAVTPLPSSERPPPNDDDLFADVTDAGVEGGEAYFILYAENKSQYWAVCDLVLWVNYTDRDASGASVRIDSSDVNFGRLEPLEGREQGSATGPANDVIDYAVAADWEWC
jgi:hypothetical protein